MYGDFFTVYSAVDFVQYVPYIAGIYYKCDVRKLVIRRTFLSHDHSLSCYGGLGIYHGFHVRWSHFCNNLNNGFLKEAWSSPVGEVLLRKHEQINPHDPFAVAVCKEDSIVGHPISSVCYMFLGKPGSSISCKVTKPRRYSHDLPQGGMDISCTIDFKGLSTRQK